MNNITDYAAMSQDEIIFINRNQDYGAFDLRRSYNENVRRAILSTIFFTAFAVGYQAISARLHLIHEQKVIDTIVSPTRIEDLQVTVPILPKKPNLPQPPKGISNAATVAMGERRPVSDHLAAADTTAPPEPEVTISDHTQAGQAGETPGLPAATAPAAIPAQVPSRQSEPVSWAEVMPEFPGGEQALLGFIRKNLNYPSYESENNIQGKAIVSFIIDEKGKVNDVKIVRSVSSGIDRESIRVIKMLPDFSPGLQSGRHVKVRYVIPLDFHLAQD
jgi:protein TonB